MKGRHYAVVVTPVTIGTAGAVTDVTASAVTLTAVMESAGYELTANLEEVSAATSARQNFVVLDDAHRLTLSVIEVNNASDPSPLEALVQSFDHFKCAFSRGTGASAKTLTGYYIRENYTGGLQGKGKQIASLSLAPVDAGTASFVRS